MASPSSPRRCYSDHGDVDRAVEALRRVVDGDVGGTYRQQLDGSFVPDNLDGDECAGSAASAA